MASTNENDYSELGAIPVESSMPDYSELGALPVNAQPQQDKMANFHALGMNRTPIDTIRDIAGGVIGGLGKGGQFIGEMMEKIPGFSALQQAAQQKTGYSQKPIDFNAVESAIASPNLSIGGELTKGASEFAPYAIAGGPSLAGQMLSSAAGGAATAEPNQENVFGYFPQGRLGAAMKFAAIPPLAKLGSSIFNLSRNALSKIDPTRVGQSIQVTHDTLHNTASDLFNEVGQGARERGVNVIKIEPKIFKTIEKKLPNTEAVRSMIAKAKTGDYDALHTLQSDMFKRGTARLRLDAGAEHDLGEEIIDLRNKLNDKIINHFNSTKNYDLAAKLRYGKGLYKQLKDTYYSRKLPSNLKNLVHEESREIPKNLMDTLSRSSVPIDQLKKFNPLAEHFTNLHVNKQNALKTLKRLGVITGFGIPTIAGEEYLRSKIFKQ